MSRQTVIKYTASEGTKITEPLGLSNEDWLIIDEALHRVARSLRRIEKEEQLQKLNEGIAQLPSVESQHP